MKQFLSAWKKYLTEDKKVYVHGYIKPEKCFYTLDEWQQFVDKMLRFQKDGHYLSNYESKLIGPDEMKALVEEYYGFQLTADVARYDLLTTKNVLDHIEDFINHRFWALEEKYGDFFKDIKKLRFAFFYSRGDLEPYVLIDDEFTTQTYGSTNNPKKLFHYTHIDGITRIQRAIDSGDPFDLSCYTVAERPFFRKKSNKIIELEANVRAGFRSDVKSYSVSNNRKCFNLHRLGYPGTDKDNLCTDLENDCNGELRTALWNEFIATPIRIIGVRDR